MTWACLSFLAMMLSIHTEFTCNKNTRSFPHKQLVIVNAFPFNNQMQNGAFSLVHFHHVRFSLLFQPVKILWSLVSVTKYSAMPSQFCVISISDHFYWCACLQGCFCYFFFSFFKLYFYCLHYYRCHHFPALCLPPPSPHHPFPLANTTLLCVSMGLCIYVFG